MFLLLKNAELYSPKYLGKKDILVCAGKIVAIEDKVDQILPGDCRVVDMQGAIVGPGLIDQHSAAEKCAAEMT